MYFLGSQPDNFIVMKYYKETFTSKIYLYKGLY